MCAQVEKSIRKKFRKNIWCKFTKAINQYELVKEGGLYCSLHFRWKGFDVDGEAFSGAEAS